MPTYKGITISVRAAINNTEPLPEHPPPPSSAIPFEDSRNATISVYVPSSPKTQFWIAYSVKPPKAIHSIDTQFFVFKLFIDDRHVVTWGVGEQDQWKGKTVFGLWENFECKAGVEKRAFLFGGSVNKDQQGDDEDGGRDEGSGVLEIKVLRATGRQRIAKVLEEFENTRIGKEGGGGVDLTSAGAAKGDHPRRFYKYALLDPTDKPFATFRYYHRTLDQLKAMEVIADQPKSETDQDHSSTSDVTAVESAQGQLSSATRHLMTPDAIDEANNEESSSTAACIESEPTNVVPKEMDEPKVRNSTNYLKRLSFPPSTRLLPSEDSVPAARSTSMGNMMFGAAKQQEWFRRTPSPVKEALETREYESPEPDGTRRKMTPSGRLREVVARAMGRREGSMRSLRSLR